jgi:hypothetical protein
MISIVVYLHFTSTLQYKFTIKIKSKFLNNTNTNRTAASKMEGWKYAPDIMKEGLLRRRIYGLTKEKWKASKVIKYNHELYRLCNESDIAKASCGLS